MYSDQYSSPSNALGGQSSFRFNDTYYLDSLSYSPYTGGSYSFRPQIHPSTHSQHHPNSSTAYFSPHNYPSSSSQIHPDVTSSYSNYDTTYLNVAVAAAYQSSYQNQYQNVLNNNNPIADPFDVGLSRHMGGLYGNGADTSHEMQPDGDDYADRKVSTSVVNLVKRKKLQDETIGTRFESESCRVCDDASSGYHFGVFTCEACKGFFRRYSKKPTVLEPCPIRCTINKNNRNNCAACRFDKCKCVGMAVDKIRFGKPPKTNRSSMYDTLLTPSVKLEPNTNDFQLMLKLLECYQSFEEHEQHPSTSSATTMSSAHSSIIFEFCHRLADIVTHENERVPATFIGRLRRHESAIKFLITGENDRTTSSWSKEPQAWVFAHNERWRLIMILLMLAFDDEQIGGGSSSVLSPTPQLPLSGSENIQMPPNDTVIERVLRLFELECDQEKQAAATRALSLTPGESSAYANANEKNIKYMKAQFVLRFVDMMANDIMSTPARTIYPPMENNYMLHEPLLYRSNDESNYLPCDEETHTVNNSQSFD